jgi:hypothetical protein
MKPPGQAGGQPGNQQSEILYIFTPYLLRNAVLPKMEHSSILTLVYHLHS